MGETGVQSGVEASPLLNLLSSSPALSPLNPQINEV